MSVQKLNNQKSSSYEAHLLREEKSAATIEKYSRYAHCFSAFVKNSPLSKEAVISYKQQLIDKYSTAGVNSILSAVNSYLDYLGRPELKVKHLKMQRKIFQPSHNRLSRDEFQRLLSAAKDNGDNSLYLLMQTMLSTGIRVSEVKHITVEAVKRGKAEISLKGKVRQILLPSKLCSMLLKYIKAEKLYSGPVFVSNSGKPLHRSSIWRKMKRLCSAARVDAIKVFPHNLRHLFAKIYFKKRNNLLELANLMGHSDINTTRIYTSSTDAEHRKWLDSVGLVT